MTELDALSGPWTGWSIQDGIRIHEKLRLTIRAGDIDGTGTDQDGEFEVIGHFNPRTQQVLLTRRYNWTTEPSQEGVGIPYEYEGNWDGAMVAGRWHPRAVPHYGGPFEMWPDNDSAREELKIALEEEQFLTTGG